MALQHRSSHADRAQLGRIGLHVAAEPQRALVAEQRLARPRGPLVPQRPRPHRAPDLRARRVQVPEAARAARRLAGARRAALEHDDVRAAPDERVGSGQPDDPAADDHDIGSA